MIHLCRCLQRTHLALIGLVLFLTVGLAATPVQARIDVTEEIRCLALTIYFEARGEPDLGKLAVGHVVMNRQAHDRFPQTVCAVVRQGGEKVRNACQFTWWCDGRNDRPTEARAWQKAKLLARRIYWDYSEDPTDGALFYHADFVSPDWRWRLRRAAKIGRHIFYHWTDRRARRSAALDRGRFKSVAEIKAKVLTLQPIEAQLPPIGKPRPASAPQRILVADGL